ncbi:MAG: hypothetical protein J7L55_02700 [Desulfurococcales archaeon]|nr:hypothetical protein [Desulfurococcales archaeon]
MCRVTVRPLLRFLVRRWLGNAPREEIREAEVGVMGEERKEEASREEISELVNALKEAVMELRETVSELSNPLARIEKVPVSESREEKPQRRGEGVRRPEESGEKPGVKESVPVLTPTLKAEEPRLEVPKLPTPRSVSGMDLRRALRLLRLVLELKGSVTPELIEKYVDLFRKLNLVGEGESEILRDLVTLAAEGSKYGLTAEDHIAVMALLAKTLGIEDRELEEESIKLLLRRVKDRIRGSSASVDEGLTES